MDNNEIKQTDKVKYQWDKYIESSGEINPSKNEPPEDPECPPSLEVWAEWNSSTSQWEGLTGLKWNQTSGFNYYMPADNCDPISYYCNKYPAGCGPVAIGMLMNYHQRPVSFTFNGSTRTINYNLMPPDILINCNPPTADKEEVAALLYYVAGKYASLWCFEISVPFYYSTKSATALYPNDIRQTFSDWGYSYPGNKIDYSSNRYRLTENLKL